MSKYRRQVFIQNAPQQGLGFLPQRRYRDDFEIDEEPLYMPSTARKVENEDADSVIRTMANQEEVDDDDDDVVPFRNQYGWDDDDDELDLEPPSTASKKVRMREIIANGCCGDEDDEPLYIPSTERD